MAQYVLSTEQLIQLACYFSFVWPQRSDTLCEQLDAVRFCRRSFYAVAPTLLKFDASNTILS